MYLKKIIASGFKSFADKITIDLENGITGVVGPNGSGKSNVVDAIRWVLGEQSVKSLRGDGNMTDVIFSGSKSRNTMHMATVSLIFDNSDKYLKLDYSEVEIRRRVYQDGTNEYSINNEKCRLKDVTDILLDSGIAKESFNIISQGKIDEIISSKANERRVILEEAAGVLKYKKRKEEALRKLEKTHNNMNRVEDIINELEHQVVPLKEQKEKALIYQEKASELENIEISLITTDITNINYTYQENKKTIENLNLELIELGINSNSNETKIETIHKNILEFDKNISELQKQLLNQNTLVEQINSEKKILVERKKYEVEDKVLHNRALDLKETSKKLDSDIYTLNLEISNLDETLKNTIINIEQLENELNKTKNIKNKFEFDLTKLISNKTELENKIKYLKTSIENNSLLPYGVKEVLENPKLNGIHNAIGNIIEVEESYTTAITTSLGANSNNVIVDDDKCAKNAINYLKTNKLGRVTFFPLNIIKSKYIESNIINIIKNEIGYINIASELIKFNPMYKNIIENQLGNVIITDNIENATKISKILNHKYKIVTLDGELLHIGGSLTGGTLLKTKSIISEKYELENYLKEHSKIISDIKDLEEKINICDYNLKSIEDKIYLLTKDKINNEEYISNKNKLLMESENNLKTVINEISGIDGILNNNLSSEEDIIINKYYEQLKIKNDLEINLENIIKKRTNIKSDLEEFEFSLKKENSIYKEKSKILKDLEIEVNRMDVKLDTLLNKLNETYSLTYESAKLNYKLEIDDEVARNKVSNLKNIIKDLGVINLGAIEEYDKVAERYDFLINQKEDLLHAENTLLEIIEEMDTVMKEEFITTFNIVKENFSKTFNELFKGGFADLRLTDPSNLLETGIEIVASPPGKKLTSISLLSGGEKTFTAISLLFAILKSRPVPFCVLDEVEAALDEVNVDTFGKYIKKLKGKTQFILITHKKKTMEYADVLYGITMQESGVSKLVSVKLEKIK